MTIRFKKKAAGREKGTEEVFYDETQAAAFVKSGDAEVVKGKSTALTRDRSMKEPGKDKD